MSVYKYKAVDKEKKTIVGLVEAANEKLAEELLKDKGLLIVSLKERKSIDLSNITLFQGVKPKDIVVFSRQFAVLISANVAIVQSLKIIAVQTKNQNLKMVISELANEIDGGARLSSAMARRPKVFSSFFVSVVKAGESSGKLDEVLNYMADELEKDYDMSAKIKGAMIYPVFVILGMGGVGIMMMVYVVPKLIDIISETGGELPMATKILMATSDFLVNFWWLLIIIIVGLIAGFKMVQRIPQGRYTIDKAKLFVPIFGKLFRFIYLVRFTRSLNTLIVGGVNISKGLAITADIVNNEIFKEIILETKRQVEDGNSIATTFLESKEVPSMVSQMMHIGEKTGRLDMVLAKITDFYTREINNLVANLVTLMEPIIMVVMGIGVLIMVAAVIMPMYNMAGQF